MAEGEGGPEEMLLSGPLHIQATQPQLVPEQGIWMEARVQWGLPALESWSL